MGLVKHICERVALWQAFLANEAEIYRRFDDEREARLELERQQAEKERAEAEKKKDTQMEIEIRHFAGTGPSVRIRVEREHLPCTVSEVLKRYEDIS